MSNDPTTTRALITFDGSIERLRHRRFYGVRDEVCGCAVKFDLQRKSYLVKFAFADDGSGMTCHSVTSAVIASSPKCQTMKRRSAARIKSQLMFDTVVTT